LEKFSKQICDEKICLFEETEKKFSEEATGGITVILDYLMQLHDEIEALFYAQIILENIEVVRSCRDNKKISELLINLSWEHRQLDASLEKCYEHEDHGIGPVTIFPKKME